MSTSYYCNLAADYYHKGLMPPVVAPDSVWDEWFRLRNEAGETLPVEVQSAGVSAPCAASGITLTVQPVRTEGKVLMPIGRSFAIVSDYVHSRRAIVEECRERNWSVHKRSADFALCVSAETAPNAVVQSEGGVLLAVWVGGVP